MPADWAAARELQKCECLGKRYKGRVRCPTHTGHGQGVCKTAKGSGAASSTSHVRRDGDSARGEGKAVAIPAFVQNEIRQRAHVAQGSSGHPAARPTVAYRRFCVGCST